GVPSQIDSFICFTCVSMEQVRKLTILERVISVIPNQCKGAKGLAVFGEAKEDRILLVIRQYKTRGCRCRVNAVEEAAAYPIGNQGFCLMQIMPNHVVVSNDEVPTAIRHHRCTALAQHPCTKRSAPKEEHK